ncbi:hypothetical protein K431DRAFT_301550 [Polychaeton citri CBS 116435]|uniref:Uncharacterized protein n=1 Tax=Polychaeton citri CBS 116435 TaxID=1314669 RepID=A0A9P4QF18_9PEZI|nr:hypothetical protein K431DRAFT_301550 [Polychaeton citri CBS 116435]
MEPETQPHLGSNAEPARSPPSKQDHVASSHSSNSSASESSALRSTPPLSGHIEKRSSVSSLDAPGNSLDSSSSQGATNSESSSSDSEGESSSEDDEDIVTLGGLGKPTINAPDLSEANDLKSRLAAFLPQMQKANAQLDKNAQNIEDVEDDEPHIEMDLGLGVLEEEDSGHGNDVGSSEHHGDQPSQITSTNGEKNGLRDHIMDDLQGRSRVSKNEDLIKEVG